MNIRKHLLIAGVAAAPLLFTACCTAVDTPTAITEEQQKNIELDASLQDKLNFEYVRTWKTENKFTNVSVRARVKTYSTWNWIFRSYQDIPLAYRFVWYDKDGKEVGQSTWSHVTVDYGEEVGFASMSPNAQVTGKRRGSECSCGAAGGNSRKDGGNHACEGRKSQRGRQDETDVRHPGRKERLGGRG